MGPATKPRSPTERWRLVMTLGSHWIGPERGCQVETYSGDGDPSEPKRTDSNRWPLAASCWLAVLEHHDIS